MDNTRKSTFAGQFYPDNPNELNRLIEGYFSSAKEKRAKNKEARAVIAPHAGYIFSGQTAADAVIQLNPDKIKRVFILGSAHHHSFKGVSVFNGDYYETPLGKIKIAEAAKTLTDEYDFIDYIPLAHNEEHCIEVEVPLLQKHLNNAEIVPVLIGSYTEKITEQLAEALKPYRDDENTAFVVSSDFSHYPDYDAAKNTDHETAKAIASGKPEQLISLMEKHKKADIPALATDLCGWTSVLTIMRVFEDYPTDWEIISMTNSGDSSYGEHDRVVGYVALAAFESEKKKNEFDLTSKEKDFLLRLARKAIEQKFYPHKIDLPESKDVPENLHTPCGAFVTLHKNGKLRGCVGRLGESEPLFEVVKSMAVSAAFHDHRFPPLVQKELQEISIEISVLTPLVPMNDISELEPGKHGVYIKKGFASGTFLPQVATDTGWSKEEFLGHCAQDKAGIGWDGWKDADVYLYKALVFSENESS
ncbi:MAG: AmmeMemoRadiSam system protein B [Bacteroidales bacterium]